MNKFQIFCAILPAAMVAAGIEPSITAKALGLIFDNGPGTLANSSLATVINLYTAPTADMVIAYVEYAGSAGPAPEWLTHAGLSL